jgi:CheY-like chemotaxis protein/anti-sigma regulatory factor (Ser/Thr protein kinase)
MAVVTRSPNVLAIEPPAPAVQPTGTPALKFLVADDDRTNRLVLCALLRQLGHAAIEAEDGAQAVALYEREQPDMVLMDVMMPGLDGYEAARRIKARTGGGFVPVLFITALLNAEALARCIEAGGDDFLTKPFNRVILESKIEALARVRALYLTLQRQHDELAHYQQHLQAEHEAAEQVFAKIVHRGSLDLPGIRYLISPAAIFNGDLLLAARRPAGGLHLLLGDFAGHGLPAAIGAMPVADIFYRMTEKGYAVSEIAIEINRKLRGVLPPGLFLAAALVELDAARRRLGVWNGGLPEVLLCDRGGKVRRRLPSRHLPLGIVDSERLDRRVEFADADDNDRLYLYTDGLTEARNERGEMFGPARLEYCLTEHATSARRFDDLCDCLARFRARADQSDDITLVEICCDAPPSPAPAGASERPPVACWRLTLELDAAALRASDPLPGLMQMAMEIQTPAEHRERIYMILAELFLNALDHGLLRLDSGLKRSAEGFARYYVEREAALAALTTGRIRLELRHEPRAEGGGRLTLVVEDSGPGFDHRGWLDQDHDNRTPAGRGIALVRTLCESLHYDDPGNRVEAVYRWD